MIFSTISMVAVTGCPSSSTTSTVAPQPPATTVTAQEGTGETLPEMTNLGNGGPLTADAAAVQRIDDQFNPVDSAVGSDYKVSGSDALSYIKDVAAFAPELSPEFSNLLTEANCALNYGIIDAKAYLTPDLTEAGAIVVLSHRTAQQLATAALKCLVSQVIGGGPGAPSEFQPCFTSFMIYDSVDNISNYYYFYVAGTDASWCTLVTNEEQQYDLQPIKY
jgi:hypothetical protein